MKFSLWTLPLLASLAACTAVKDMDEMKNTTKEMNATTKELLVETKEVSKRTDRMAALTEKVTELTERMAKITEQMGERTKLMADVTVAMGAKIDKTNESMVTMLTIMKDLGVLTKQMNETTQKMADRTKHMADVTDAMGGKIDKTNDSMITMLSLMRDLSVMTGRMRDITEAMGKQTEAMGKKTDRMAEVTEGMGTKMDEQVAISKALRDGEMELVQLTTQLRDLTSILKDTSWWTYKDLRQGNSMTTRSQRNERMETLQALGTVSSIEKKISEAAKYMMAFEFQLWKGGHSDTMANREKLFGEAAQEFLTDMAVYLPLDGKLKVNPAATKDSDRNLLAIVMVLDMINTNQLDVQIETGIAPVTLLDVIEKGLKYKIKVEQGQIASKDIPVYAKEVLAQEQRAVHILQLRYNFVAGVALSKLTAMPEKMGLDDKIQALKKLALPWSPDYSKLNVVQIDFATDYLKWSNDTRKVLVDIGVQPKFDKLLKGIYKHIQVTGKDDVKAPSPRATAIAGLGLELLRLKSHLDQDIEIKNDDKDESQK